MGRTISLFIICATILLSAGGVSASTLSIDVDVNAASFNIIEDGSGLFRLDAEGMNRTNYLELPSLPYRVVSVLLPQGADVVSFRLEGGREIELAGSVSLAAFNGQLMGDGTSRGVALQPGEATGEDSLFPAWRVRHVGTSGWKGYRIATFEVYPVRYDLSTGRLAAVEGMTLVVETAPGELGTDAKRQRHVDGFREASRRGVRRTVVNPLAASDYLFTDIVVPQTSREFLPSYMPGMEGSEVQYLIVTNEEMEPEFQRLADWKTQKGVPSVVRTIEWIEQNTRAGADLGETVRNFIRDAYEKWGVEYVLIGGDTAIIPERLAYVSFYTGDFIPTDMYYGCLDGTWNADGDSLWGEGFHSLGDPGDDVDLYAEIYVGRLPAVNLADAQLLVDKTINYEAPSDTTYKSDFLLLGEVIYPSDYTPGDNIVNDGAEYLQLVYDQYFVSDPDISTVRLYENFADYPGSHALTMSAALDSMSAGFNHVVHAGHGGKYNMSLGDASMVNSDADDLTNGTETFSMYLLNCNNGAFDTDCIAEYFMLNRDGGAFGVVASSRTAFPSVSRIYLDEYYGQLFQNDVMQFGRIIVAAREPFTPAAHGETADRWTHFITNWLGDPETSMYRGSPGVFDVTAPMSVIYGHNEITIQVDSDGAPFDSAYVCLYKDGDDYQYAYTDMTGQVIFDDFLVREGGTITVTVTGIDHCLYTTSIDVDAETSAYLRVNRVVPNDDTGGNGDGIIDAGEVIRLWIELYGTGDMMGLDLWAEISTPDPAVILNNGISTYPDISSGATAFNNTSFMITVDPAVADETPVEFTIEIHDSTGGYWTEQFAIEIHAPELELFVNMVTDSVPFGDGNGLIESGEQFLLRVGVKNFGTGTATGLQGKIRAEDAGITVIDSTASYIDLVSMDTWYGSGFVLIEADVVLSNHFTFELTDVHGNTFSSRMELRGPIAPYNLLLDSSIGPDQIHATWYRPDSLEAYRYHVYHSTISGGPYELASTDMVFHTLFRDRNLEFSTRYYLVVAAVDSCGNIGEFSDESSETTSPPQLAGWPNAVDQGSSSSPAVADINGDTRPDIVFGAGDVFAWDHQGIEIIDGDNLPLTWGVFATEGSSYTASIALGDLGGTQGHEIVGASWDTREIYVWAPDGSVLPGWPQTTTDLCWASPVIGDFDGDGDREIIAYDVDGTVYVWHHDGTELLDGDSNPGTNGPFFAAGLASDGWHVSTPALADMDNDGIVEIVVAAPSDSIYVLNADQSSVAGWPVHIGDEGASVGASPVVGDIDGDTFPEVIMQNSLARVLGLNHDGTPMTGWPQWVNGNSFFAGSAALADLTGDGRLEVVIPGMDGLCYIFRHDGSSLPGWPQEYSTIGGTESSPVIADVSGDGELDILLGGEDGRISGWNQDGSYIAGFPIQLKNFIRGTPSVKDIDIDGDLELIAACWDQNVYVWDLEATYYRGCVQWNGFHGNRFNSGWKELVTSTDAAVTAWMYELSGRNLQLTWAVSGDDEEWDLYRRARGEEYVLAARGLRDDGSGTVTWTDGTVEEGVFYEYRLESDGGLNSVETGPIEVPVSSARLYQNHPNPFNPSTKIVFTIPGDSATRQNAILNVYDVKGALVKTLVNGPVAGGRHEVAWDGNNNRGTGVSSGVYFAKFASGGFSSVKKMILVR